MKTSDATATATAGCGPAVDESTDGNVLARAFQGVRNRISAWWQPVPVMFDFTDEYFAEFPATPRPSSYTGWRENDLRADLASLSLLQVTSLDEGVLSMRGQGRLSAARTAMLLLAGPSLGAALDSISQPFSGLPPNAQADACRMLCFPGAGADVLQQRRISWVPHRRQSLAAAGTRASPPNHGTAKINLPPTARNLPSAPGTPTFLDDSAAWNDAVINRLALDQLKTFMGALPRDQWPAYLKLRTDIRNLAATISSDFRTRANAWEDSSVAAINKAINAEVGAQAEGSLDCRNSWLHTDYYEVNSRTPRALAEGQLVSKRRSVRLWDAARQGFSYAVAWNFGAGRDFAAASFISSDRAGVSPVSALGVSRFADIVRMIDPGARAAQLVDQLLEPGSLPSQRLHDLHVNTMTFDIMDAARSPAQTGVDAAALTRLRSAVSQVKGTGNWRRYRAEFGITVPALGVGQWVQLPFFIYDIEGLGFVAHAMGRPDYPLRIFSDLAQGEAWLNATADLSAPWLQAQLSGDDRERAVALRKSLAQVGAPLPGLNPVAVLLRDTVSALLPTPAITLAVDSRLVRRLPMAGGPPTDPWKLAGPGRDFARSRISANVGRLATPSGQLDWAYATQAGLEMASEILELLITPVPGGMAGLNRMRTIAFGGFIGLNLARGSLDASQGDGTRITGTVVDILDLAFGLYSGRAAAMADIRQAGYRRIPLSADNSADGLWRFDVDAMVRPAASMVDGQQPSNDGVIHVLGQSFVRLELPTGTTAVLAANRGGDGTWRLRPSNAVGYAPAITRSGSLWSLHLDDAPGVNDIRLLSRSFSKAGIPGARDTVTRLQDITGITRAELDRIWDGEAPPSWFDGAATRVAIHDILNRMLSTFPGHHEPVHAIGEAFYVQFLADTLSAKMHVVDDNGVTAYMLNPRKEQVTSGGEFVLHRQPGGFYGATRNAPRGERVGIPGILDVVLAEQPVLGSSYTPSAGVTALEARRRLVNHASDAWMRRHVRAIGRACLCAFDLETSRQTDDFLAAGQAAAGRRLPALDARADAMLANLQYRHPGLTRADAIAVLADQTLGPLARSEPDADRLADVLGDLRMFSRVMAARFRALSGQYDADSEALLLTGLTSHPAWPGDRAIEVMQGGLDPQTGDVISHGLSMARFGGGHKSMILIRAPDGSHRVADIPGADLVIPQQRVAHSVPLIDKVIQALPTIDRQNFQSSAAINAASVVASMDIPATSRILVDTAAQGIRATTPLATNYAAPILPDAFPQGPVDGYYHAYPTLRGGPRSFVKIDGVMVRAVPDAGDPARARLRPHVADTYPDMDNAPVVRLDRRGHWRLVRVEGDVQRDLVNWESAGGGFSHPTTLLIPLDGIETIATAGSTWRSLVGRDRIKVVFDFDFQAWRSIDEPGRVFRRAQGQWYEGAVTGVLDVPTQFATIEVPSIPVPPVDARPLPQTIGYGWTGRESPSAAWLARLTENARTARAGKSGWSSQLHVDLDDASQVQRLKTTLAPIQVQVNDLRRDRAFLDWLQTPAGRVYSAARDGAYPCNSSAMDVLRFGWILKRHGGLYLDMDDAILKDWASVGELRAGPFQLLSGGPVYQALLGLDWDINTSHLGSHAGNPLLDRVVDTMVERAARKPAFFREPPRGSAETYGRQLSDLTGPGVLRDVLEQHAPEIPGLIGAMRVLRGNDIRYEALELAVAEATEAYFPLAQRIEPGHANSWMPSDD
jgi:hypothetical protein